jgi:hypothetical protein
MFRVKYGQWPRTIPDLVANGFLPEWSEVHFCPSELGFHTRLTQHYKGTDFVDKNRTGFVAHYSASPYRFQEHQGDFKVECTHNHQHR